MAGYYFASRYLPHQLINRSKQEFDYIGILLFALFAVLLVLSLSQSEQVNLVILLGAILGLIAFWLYEKEFHPLCLILNYLKSKPLYMGIY